MVLVHVGFRQFFLTESTDSNAITFGNILIDTLRKQNVLLALRHPFVQKNKHIKLTVVERKTEMSSGTYFPGKLSVGHIP
jgi:hypothetical protein